MVGLNHEMARELLWREYPTDQRGTYFRQFWDVARARARAGAGDDRRHRADRPLARRNSLGANLPAPGGAARRDRSRRAAATLPDAAVYAVPATLDRAVRAPPGACAPEPTRGTPKFPVFRGRLEPDLHYFGFSPLTADAVRGSKPQRRRRRRVVHRLRAAPDRAALRARRRRRPVRPAGRARPDRVGRRRPGRRRPAAPVRPGATTGLATWGTGRTGDGRRRDGRDLPAAPTRLAIARLRPAAATVPTPPSPAHRAVDPPSPRRSPAPACRSRARRPIAEVDARARRGAAAR